MRMLKENFEAALRVAIATFEAERFEGFESIFHAGLKEILAASERGEKITIEEE